VSTFELFKCAERIEAVSAALYAALARRFRDDPEAHALFVRLGAEELQHASRIRLVAASYRNDSGVLERVRGAKELEACLAESERALADVEAGIWGSDVTQVKRRLRFLEAELSRAHAHTLLEDGDPGLRDFFRQLAAQDAAHAELLKP
jgi:rubrerythrin